MINLNVKSEYDIFESILSIENILFHSKKAVGINFSNTNGLINFYFKAREKNIKPIFVFDYIFKGIKMLIIPTDFDSYSRYIGDNIVDLNNDEKFIKIILDEKEVIGKNIFYGITNDDNSDFHSDKEIVYINSIKYINKEDKSLYKALYCLKRGIKYQDANTKDYHLINEDELKNKKAIENSYKIADLVNIILPSIENIKINNSIKILRDKVRRDKNIERVNKELEIIEEKDLSSYFLLVEEIITMAKELGIMIGPGRGSAVSSYICYLLNIIKINPLKYDLIFERFLNSKRVSLPDIDIDIEHNKRDRLIEKIQEKYEAYEIVNYSRFSEKSAEIALSRICNKIDARKFSKSLSGIICAKTKHPAGIVISNNIKKISTSENKIINLDLNEIELLKGIKIDLLPLRTLSILNILSKVTKAELKDIPLNDKKSFDIINFLDTKDIFQLESESAKSIIKKVKPNNIEQLADVLALNRPAALENSVINNYPQAVIYQEQIIKLLQKRGFSLEDADLIIRSIKKKDVNILNKINLNSKEREFIEKFSSYSFPKSHAIAYAHITFYTSYFKSNFPLEFSLALEEVDNIEKDIDINFSTVDYCLSNNKVKKGLSYILNKKLSETIVKERNNNGFYLNIDDVVKRIELKEEEKKIIKNLISLTKQQQSLFNKKYDFYLQIDISSFSENKKQNLKSLLTKSKGENIEVKIKNRNKINELGFKVSFSSLKKLRDSLLGDIIMIKYI